MCVLLRSYLVTLGVNATPLQPTAAAGEYSEQERETLWRRSGRDVTLRVLAEYAEALSEEEQELKELGGGPPITSSRSIGQLRR